jgi:hypothetical protein
VAAPGLKGEPAPEVLVKKLGGTVKTLPWPKDRIAYQVDLKGTKTTDADLAAIARMKDIHFLDLSFTRVTDKGLAGLAGYKKLQSLNLLGSKVTDAVLNHLEKIPDLNSVNVAQTEVTENGIVQFAKVRSNKGDFRLCRTALGDKARFQVHQQFLDGEVRLNYLMIGDTYYGNYLVGKKWPPDTDPRDRRREASTYYHRDGPVGQVLGKLEWFRPTSPLDYRSDVRLPASLVGTLAPAALPTPLPARALVDLWSEPALAVVRLNVGTHAAYGRPYQHIHFYNSTPELKSFSLPAEDEPVYFGFIQDAMKRGCRVQIFDGDERATLGKKGPRRFYSAVFVDITKNDLRDINTKLLTREAVADMMASLTETGVLCFHTSHRYHDMVPPIVDAAQSLKLVWKVGKDAGVLRREGRNFSSVGDAHFSSEWVMIARRDEYLRHLTEIRTEDRMLEWFVPAGTGKHLWRDGQPHNLKALARAMKK